MRTEENREAAAYLIPISMLAVCISINILLTLSSACPISVHPHVVGDKLTGWLPHYVRCNGRTSGASA